MQYHWKMNQKIVPSTDPAYLAGENNAWADFDFALDTYVDLPFEWDGPVDLAKKLKALLDAKDAEIAALRKA